VGSIAAIFGPTYPVLYAVIAIIPVFGFLSIIFGMTSGKSATDSVDNKKLFYGNVIGVFFISILCQLSLLFTMLSMEKQINFWRDNYDVADFTLNRLLEDMNKEESSESTDKN